jgi:transposase
MRPRTLSLRAGTVEKLRDLMREAESDGAYRVARRIHAVILNSDGRTSGDIASTLMVGRSRVSEWLRNYERDGYEALLEGVRPGRPAALDEKGRVRLADIVESGPVAYGFLSGVWTSPMIARVIAEEFGVRYHPGHVRRLLHALGFSVQRPKRLLVKADPEKRDRWHKIVYPALKRSPGPSVRRSSTTTRPRSDRTRPSTRRGRERPTSRRSR